jgi:hypothetical protein
MSLAAPYPGRFRRLGSPPALSGEDNQRIGAANEAARTGDAGTCAGPHWARLRPTTPDQRAIGDNGGEV